MIIPMQSELLDSPLDGFATLLDILAHTLHGIATNQRDSSGRSDHQEQNFSHG
jgi:hypothetical protein